MGFLADIRDEIILRKNVMDMQVKSQVHWTNRLTDRMRISILENEKTLNQALIMMIITIIFAPPQLKILWWIFFAASVWRMVQLMLLLKSIRTFLEKPENIKGTKIQVKSRS